MSSPAECITHGGAIDLLVNEDLTERLNDFDEGFLEYLTPSRSRFRVGASAPGYPNLTIQEVKSRPEPDGDFMLQLRVRGIINGSSKRIGLSWRESPSGWDEAQESLIVPRTTAFTWGTALQGASNMRLVDLGEEDQLDNRWAVRQMTYRGIKSTGLTHRRITVNENIVSPSQPVVVDLPGGWAPDALQGTISMPRVVVTDTFKSTDPPDTEAIPGNKLPVDPPPVQVFTLTGELTWQWPTGWKLASMDAEELYQGAGLWIITYVYEYVWEATF